MGIKTFVKSRGKINLILNKSVSEGVFLSQRRELALPCDVQECSVPWKIKQGSLEILNNSRLLGGGTGSEQNVIGAQVQEK